MFEHYEGFLYVATVLDLFSRRIVGWSMDSLYKAGSFGFPASDRRTKHN